MRIFLDNNLEVEGAKEMLTNVASSMGVPSYVIRDNGDLSLDTTLPDAVVNTAKSHLDWNHISAIGAQSKLSEMIQSMTEEFRESTDKTQYIQQKKVDIEQILSMLNWQPKILVFKNQEIAFDCYTIVLSDFANASKPIKMKTDASSIWLSFTQLFSGKNWFSDGIANYSVFKPDGFDLSKISHLDYVEMDYNENLYP